MHNDPRSQGKGGHKGTAGSGPDPDPGPFSVVSEKKASVQAEMGDCDVLGLIWVQQQGAGQGLVGRQSGDVGRSSGLSVSLGNWSCLAMVARLSPGAGALRKGLAAQGLPGEGNPAWFSKLVTGAGLEQGQQSLGQRGREEIWD